ncbi:histidine triad nucleotide-binding protein [Nocardioides marmoriginsengisoli]|uniref:Histidine triad nucleotide-binding protein n=1 Tax=Nocardioides marmoriginsengisoli TaxID=661483 RepID=A0A3N0CJU5_9ACTN|nr:histidine triad nucleotide-binding protein [Nocardioides marmoriginsengisoli]RNL63714.1 histidine triad nucleotide-binding protein [Nocardioides marmoriginsengisoli]
MSAADPACIFCRIVAGEIPAEKVHESETTFAFRDLTPQAPTHVLVIPRSHYPNAAELAAGEPATAAHLFDAAREIAAAEGLGNGYRLVFNTGADAHQTVFHVHMHLLGGRPMGWPPG